MAIKLLLIYQLVFLFLGLCVVQGCASPVAPTGGPVDATPPEILRSEPSSNSVNVQSDALTLYFSEYIDRASFQQAFSVTPEFATPPDIHWRGRRVRITLPEPLRANTTYIFTLDTNLRDVHSVALKQPITLAIATGPEIDQGRLAGRVRHPDTDAGTEGLAVFAYAVEDSAPPAMTDRSPDFRTQTGTDGRFSFSYLPEQPFFVLAVEDRNRNRRLDPGEAFAVPPVPALLAVPDSTTPPDSLTWFLTRHDTLPPSITRLRPMTSRRIQLSFSESIRLTSTDPNPWTLEDSTLGQPVSIQAVYVLPEDPRLAYLLTDSLASHPHRLRPAAVTDSSGNAVLPEWYTLAPVARADTFSLRFRGFLPTPPFRMIDSLQVLWPGTAPGVAFSEPVPDDRLQALVTLQDSLGRSLTYTPETEDGVRYALHASPPLPPGTVVEATVDGTALGQDTLYAQRFQVPPATERGEASGYIRSPLRPVIVELFPDQRSRQARRFTARVDGTGHFLVPDLPGGPYYVRAFVDIDSSGTWTGGRLMPYLPAEPLTWFRDSLVVRVRWETSLPDTLTLPAY